MTPFVIVLLGFTSLVSAKPTFLSVPLTYATLPTSGTQIDTNVGETLNGPEFAGARVDERTGVANGAARSPVEFWLLRGRQSSSLVRDGAPPISTSSAPLGADGRVVDTPEVAAAKAAHATAHVNERINLANEIARSGGGVLDSSDVADSGDRVPNAPEVAATRANEKSDLANEVARSGEVVNGHVVPLVLGNGIVAALVPINPDGRPLDVLEIATHGDQNLANNAKSINALAVAGSALAYGRLVY